MEEEGTQGQKVNTHQSANEGIGETEAEKEAACVCLPRREEGEEWVGIVARDAPRPCSLDMGPFPVHLTADCPCSGKGQAGETGGFEPESQVWHFLAAGPWRESSGVLVKWLIPTSEGCHEEADLFPLLASLGPNRTGYLRF